METLLAVGALVAAGYVMASADTEPREHRDRKLAEYLVPGSTFEDLSGALAKGYRLIELHVYSDAQDEPVVALQPNYDQVAHRSFDSCCEVLVNEAFPSDDPLILSIVAHTDKSFTLNRVAYHLNTTVRKHYVTGNVEEMQLDSKKPPCCFHAPSAVPRLAGTGGAPASVGTALPPARTHLGRCANG